MEKCKTCGRDKLVHTEWDFDKSICKKFIPEDEISDDILSYRLGIEHQKAKQKEGCGKVVWQKSDRKKYK